MIAFDRYLYVFGGVADNTLPSDLYRYSTACLIIVNNNKKRNSIYPRNTEELKVCVYRDGFGIGVLFFVKEENQRIKTTRSMTPVPYSNPGHTGRRRVFSPLRRPSFHHNPRKGKEK